MILYLRLIIQFENYFNKEMNIRLQREIFLRKFVNGVKETYLLGDRYLCKFTLDSRNEAVFWVGHSHTNAGPLR